MVRNASGDLAPMATDAVANIADQSFAFGSGVWPFMTALRTWLGRNTRTRRGAIGPSSPVLGLRPMRWLLRRTAKVPKDESFTVSPAPTAEHTSPRLPATN